MFQARKDGQGGPVRQARPDAEWALDKGSDEAAGQCNGLELDGRTDGRRTGGSPDTIFDDTGAARISHLHLYLTMPSSFPVPVIYQSVETFLDIVTFRPFDVALVSGGSGPTHADFLMQWEQILPVIAFALPSVPQWGGLHLFSNYLPTLQFMLDQIMDYPGLSITSLSITRYIYLAPRLFREPRALTISGSLASMTAFHLVSVPVPFTHLIQGHSLINLAIKNLSWLAWPYFDDFLDCMTVSPHLTHLSICATGCKFLPPAEAALLHLPSVLHLRLMFSRTNDERQRSGFLFISRLRFPSLLSLNLALETTALLTSFLNYGIRLQAPTVLLACESRDVMALVELYTIFDQVVSLDLHGSCFRAITSLQHHLPSGLPILPLLRELVVLEDEWNTLYKMVQRRSAHARSLTIFVLSLEDCAGIHLPHKYHQVVARVANVVWVLWPVLKPTFSHHNYFN
ncbi:hypothetical protein K438DRAFT_1995910 [Mycena galopus ATCC 62051]|nr:hypothetical protein K438DRAFT_1995910 [Mycena galopus ATCC 62051]